MVLADRSANESKYNGSGARRGRAASPVQTGANNGHLTDDSNNSDDSDHGMRVGGDYQATVPEMVSSLPGSARHDWSDLTSSAICTTAPDHEPERAVLIWSPCNEIPESKLDDYLNIAKEKYNYNNEQALGMLCWHKFNLEKAMADLPNFTPFPDEWTVEDKVLFEQAFQFHDKHFHKIRQMLPDKSIASLVKYYYSWKKTRTRTSLMDRQARKLTSQKDEGSDVSEASDNESDAGNGPKDTMDQSMRDGKPMCSNCFTTSSGQFHNTNKGVLCRTCYSYWRRTGAMKSSGPQKKHDSGSGRLQLKPRKPPRGMYLNHEDLLAIANGPPGQGDAILKGLDSEVITLKRNVQNNKQIISQYKHKIADGIEAFRPNENTTRINSRWTNDELLLAVQGVRKYGKDFRAIGEVIGNKSETHVRTFFANHQRRFNLTAVLKEYENENGVIEDDENKDKNDSTDSSGVERPTSPPSSANNGGSQSISNAGSAPPPLRPILGSNAASGSAKSEKSTLLPRQPPPPLTSNSNSRSNKS